ncbi:MAG: vitamin B12 ABC transporter substrate-binding protein BtuF, partial [Vibrio sp.]
MLAWRITLFTLISLSALPTWAAPSTSNTQHRFIAQRIITLAPHLTELAFRAGLGDHIVGVSEYSDYPKQAQNIETIANYQGIKVERVLALKPDLIIAWQQGPGIREVDKLESMGIKVVRIQTQTLAQIGDNIQTLSQFSASPKIGEQQAQNYRQTLEKITQANQNKPKISFFYQLSDKPLISVGGDGWANEIFSRCGGRNILSQSLAPYPQVSQEQVLKAKPEVIFSSHMSKQSGQIWQKWQDFIPALKNSHVYALNPDWISRPTYRTLNAMQQICGYFDKVR